MSPKVEKIIKELKKAKLSQTDRIALTTAITDKLNALPMGDIIAYSREGLIINGKVMDLEQTANFKLSVTALEDNFARQVIHEQLRFKAVQLGLDKATSIDELFFAKAVIWSLNEENKLIKQLSTI